MATVLIVDDEKGIRDLLRKVLEKLGYRVVTAADGNEGLAVFRLERPELVITDIIMPNREGIEAITVMKRENPGVKVLAISGGGRAHAMDLLAVAPSAGADATLEKPFRASDLLEWIERLMGAGSEGGGR
ncbi:MAG: response regulator [Alphaproteobacteria bacterium]|nr:response regulator [Alphaproteobacteria bacterium]MBF0129145.1 response regulator [Alphaproteobacteria bacterium]